jgi:hypothetical protein
MNLKKLLPIVFIVLLAIITISIKRCNPSTTLKNSNVSSTRNSGNFSPVEVPSNTNQRFNRKVSEIYFTKHAKCRMACRHISQQEVREILAGGNINYNKSDLNDPKGATYALEGTTRDEQHVRIIFAPKQSHMSVVTVIDLDNDYQCNCN